MKSTYTFKSLIFFALLFVPCLTSAQQIAPSCGTNDSLTTAYLEKISKQIDLTAARTNVGEMLEYRLAIDVDYKTATLYQQDQVKIRKAVYKLFADASAIFEREMNIKLTVTYIHIWQQPEPYELKEDLDYFIKVSDYWNNNLPVERDALVGVSTRYGWFYGGYRMATANFPEPDATLAPDLLAHELGHTLGSPHTHNCFWPGGPIDRCTDVEGTSEACPPGSNQEFVNGSIMSYCRSKLTFHPLCRNLIREYAEGKIDPSFSLKPFSEKPAIPGLLTVLARQGDATDFTPSFEWLASERSLKYRFQIATDEAFSKMTEDTLVNQSFFRSPGQNDGIYFARYRPENSLGASEWSVPVRFRVDGWSQSTLPPPLMGVTRTSDGTISGSFRNLEGISSYQLQLELPYNNELIEATGQTGSPKTQYFSTKLPIQKDLYYILRYRVNKHGTWSEWSTSTGLETAAFTTHISSDSTQPTSTKPILALRQWVPLMTTDAFTGQMEISSDPLFKNSVFQQTFSNNAMGDWFNDKTFFTPSLEENTTYFARSRMQIPGFQPSAWETSQFTTGVHDNRFKFLGAPSKVLHSTSYSSTSVLYNRFLKAGEHLYVFNYNGGYHHTTDLQSWKTYLPSTTNGQSPMQLAVFGAAPNGQTLTIDPLKSLVVRRDKDMYQRNPSPIAINWNDIEATVYSEKDGYFFKNLGEGVVQIKDSIWTFHRDAIQLGRPVCLVKDNLDRIWVMGEWGFVWRYENNGWTSQPQFPLWENVSGMAFDRDDNCYAYGAFGVLKLNTNTGQWEPIASLMNFSVKKIVFANDGSMWLASYRPQRDNAKLENYALVKFSNGKTSIYADGLNFLREQFDIEYFKDQLLIMTTGGEIHSFDEKQILSFTPQETYCAGQQLSLGLATNSTFAPENKTSVQLRQAGTEKIITWETANPESHRISTSLPNTLPQGRYSLSIHTTAPEITSYQSAEFEVMPTSSCNEAKGIMLLQNRPNPIGLSGSISFYLPQNEAIRLELFNLLGQKIADLAHGNLPAGWHIVDVNGTSLASGVYVYRLKAGKITKSLKMIRN